MPISRFLNVFIAVAGFGTVKIWPSCSGTCKFHFQRCSPGNEISPRAKVRSARGDMYGVNEALNIYVKIRIACTACCCPESGHLVMRFVHKGSSVERARVAICKVFHVYPKTLPWHPWLMSVYAFIPTTLLTSLGLKPIHLFQKFCSS